jgi:hypothetical protein
VTIVCSNCGHEESDTALFCTECNTKLVDLGGQRTLAIDSLPSPEMPVADASVPKTENSQAAHISLHLSNNGPILPLVGNGEFILGRVSEGQSVLPDVDLEPFHGFEAGVSRLHAVVRLYNGEASITDLGSSNGTQINQKPLSPHVQHPLKHKDFIRLGRLDIQAFMNEVDN